MSATNIEKKKVRASPKIQEIHHTQDFFTTLAFHPQDLPTLLAKFDLQSRRILEAIAFSFTHESKSAGQFLATRSGMPWFKFSFVNPDGKTFSLRPHNIPRSGIPKNVDVVKCRKCGEDTFYLAITILQPPRFNGETPRPKMGYLTVECSELALDHISFEDFGFRKE